MAAEGVVSFNAWAAANERQWGRDRMAAEGRLSTSKACAEGNVNGAATGWPRKGCLLATH